MKRYSKNWHKPAVAKDIERYEQVDPDTKVVVCCIYKSKEERLY